MIDIKQCSLSSLDQYLLPGFNLHPDTENDVNLYTEAINSTGDSVVAALNEDTGEINWFGLDDFSFEGEFAGRVLYSSTSFGLVRAYRASDHEFLWENDSILRSGGVIVYGIAEDTVIAKTAGSLVGLDADTGQQTWRVEDDELENVRLLDSYVIYERENGKAVDFIDALTGRLISGFSISSHLFRWHHEYSYLDGLVIITSSDGIAVISVPSE